MWIVVWATCWGRRRLASCDLPTAWAVWVKVQKFVSVISADYGPVRWRTVICRFSALSVEPMRIIIPRNTGHVQCPRCVVWRSLRRLATSEARPTRPEQLQWIKYSLHEKWRFVDMTFLELDLNTLLHISLNRFIWLEVNTFTHFYTFPKQTFCISIHLIRWEVRK